MQTYHAPEGYQLDPSSGLYFRETQIPGPDGQLVRHIVWFNAETGEYTQQSYYQLQQTPQQPDPWADARHGGGGYAPEPPPPPKRPIFKRIVIPVVTVICVTVIAVVGIKVVPPLIEKAGETGSGSAVQGGDSKPSGGGLFGGGEKQTKEGEIGNTVMNLQNGGLMAYHNGWVYYADATKGGALYARKEGQSADKAILIAPGQICAINVLGDELVYINSASTDYAQLSISGGAVVYLPHRYGRTSHSGGYCPANFWPQDYNARRNTEMGHVAQFYAGMVYKLTGVKQFEKSGGGLSKPIPLGKDGQNYFDLVLTKEGVFAACGEPGASYENMRSYNFVQLSEGTETTTQEMPDGRRIRGVRWMEGAFYIWGQNADFDGTIYRYDPKTQELSEVGDGYSLLAWDNSLFYIDNSKRNIIEVTPGAATGNTVYTRENDMGLLLCETDGKFAALSGSWGKEYIFERQGASLNLVSETESGEDETAEYLTSCAIFELGKKMHKYFDRYGDGIIPY